MSTSCESVFIETVHGLKERVLLRYTPEQAMESDLQPADSSCGKGRKHARTACSPIVVPTDESETSLTLQE